MNHNILCMGEALIDMICSDAGKPLSEGVHFLKKAGGAPTNVAAAIAALGGKVSLAARVGADPFGQFLIQTVERFGVDVQFMVSDPEHFTTFAFVSLMENGERDFYFNRGADGLLGIPDMKDLHLSDFGIVHFGSATAFLQGPLRETYRYMLGQAAGQGKYISFDPNYRHLLYQDHQSSFIEQSWHFLKACHFFKVSDEEALLLTGTTQLDQAVSHFRNHCQAVFCITLGSAGTLLCLNGETISVPSIAVKSVDSTGAGDAFVGAMLFQLAGQSELGQQHSVNTWVKMVENANRAGARTCCYMGAMEAISHLNAAIFD